MLSAATPTASQLMPDMTWPVSTIPPGDGMGSRSSVQPRRTGRRRGQDRVRARDRLGFFLPARVDRGIARSTPLSEQSGLPAAFMQLIALAEVLGAAGLILPGALRVRRGLTPLAAVGLAVIMAGATVLSSTSFGMQAAILPLVTGVAAVVARGLRVWAAGPPLSALCAHRQSLSMARR